MSALLHRLPRVPARSPCILLSTSTQLRPRALMMSAATWDAPKPREAGRDGETSGAAAQGRAAVAAAPPSGKRSTARAAHTRAEGDGHIRPGSTVPSSSPSPLHQLARCDELRRRTGAENRKSAKQAIIAEYPDLRDLLEFILQPKLRLGLTPAVLAAHLAKTETNGSQALERSDSQLPATLVGLFRDLQHASGTGARDLVARFVIEHGIWKGTHAEAGASRAAVTAGSGGEAPFETFCRLLRRSLNAGWSATTLGEVQWGAAQDQGGTEPHAAMKAQQRSETTAQKKTLPARKLDKFSVALGKTILPPFTELFKTGSKGTTATEWYASRKLDGVRCVTFIDVRVGADHAVEGIEDIRFMSRQGNEFTSLGKLRAFLEPRLAAFPPVHRWLARDPTSVRDGVKRLVLDGEVCVLNEDGAGGYVEDFPAVVSQVRRKNVDIEHPAYFLLDVLPWCEFSGRGVPLVGARTFMQRHRDAVDLAAWLGDEMETETSDASAGGGVREGVAVKLLPQQRIRTPADVDAMVERATTNGWEGLVFRADRPYKGKRSSDVYKFKHWQDAEYTVVALDTSVQRLSVGGTYGEHLACSNVWIEHAGHRVSVGSGFTTEQRLRYAAHPEEIVGKQITVEYFAESSASGRQEASLRFPRVKTVWDEGKRSV